jgi:hypothetical protein
MEARLSTLKPILERARDAVIAPPGRRVRFGHRVERKALTVLMDLLDLALDHLRDGPALEVCSQAYCEQLERKLEPEGQWDYLLHDLEDDLAYRRDPGEQPIVIVALGGRQYQVGNGPPLVVNANEDILLQAFARQPAQDDAALRNTSGLDCPGKVLRDLRKKYDHAFEPAIRAPGRKGAGGYHAIVRLRP